MNTLEIRIEEIRAREEALHRPEIRRSRQALEDLLAESFCEFGASVTVYRRADMIELLLRETDSAGNGELYSGDYALRPISADAALLTYRTWRKQAEIRAACAAQLNLEIRRTALADALPPGHADTALAPQADRRSGAGASAKAGHCFGPIGIPSRHHTYCTMSPYSGKQPMEAAVEKLLERYQRLFRQALAGKADMDEVATLYASDVIAASPAGVRSSKNDDGLKRMMAQGYERYRSIGTKEMTLRHIRLSTVDESHCVARVAWRATYAHKDQPDTDIDFEVHYLVQVLDGDAKVFGWVSGDEQALLKQHGIG